MNSTQAHKAESAMADALTRFYREHPEVDGIALDTVREFADLRFFKAATPERIDDPRFEEQAPVFAYRLLVEETLMLAKAMKDGGKSYPK